MSDDIRSTAELRAMFGSNLRRLSKQYPSVSALCRQLGINRTQFNRYLLGESFPRPEVLDRICRFFEVDARILLKPLDEITLSAHHPAASTLTDFLGSGSVAKGKSALISGFYSVTERPQSTYPITLLYARQLPQCTLIRGYTSRFAMPGAVPGQREVRGIAACTEQQVYMILSRRDGENSRIYQVSQPNENTSGNWRGTVINPSGPSKAHAGQLVTLQYLGRNTAAVFDAARKSSGAGPQTRDGLAQTQSSESRST